MSDTPTPQDDEKIDSFVTTSDDKGSEENRQQIEFSFDDIEWPDASDLVDEPATKPLHTCNVCGYYGPGMGLDTPICRECHVYEDPRRYCNQFVIAWMPDYSPKGLSLLTKLLPLADKTEIWEKLAEQATLATYSLSHELRNIRNIEAFISYDPKSKLSNLEQRLRKFQLTKTTLGTIKKAIAVGIERGARIAGGASILELLDAMEVMPLVERVNLESGLRYIPRTIDPEVISGVHVEVFAKRIFEAISDDLTTFGIAVDADAALLDETTIPSVPVASRQEGA
jgi:hypothetical protein